MVPKSKPKGRAVTLIFWPAARLMVDQTESSGLTLRAKPTMISIPRVSC